MIRLSFFTAFAISLILLGCSNDYSNSESIQSPGNTDPVLSAADNTPSSNSSTDIPLDKIKLDGMLLQEGGAQVIYLADKMTASLNYSYFMGIHEVTCGEYGASCESDSLPVADVTFYDAVLYANAKSKKENYDTVYTYTKAYFDNQKHCTHLENFTFHYNVDGYRLPTEAEWIFAATKGWDTQFSWNSENSGNIAHKVCTNKNPAADFCDMAGNVMEWVNDWLYTPADTSLTNFIGAASSEGLGERILKGGSYTNSPQSINLLSKGDVYTVTSSTRADYVGFRLAFGKIPEPSTISSDKKTSESHPTVIANNETLKSLTGMFVNKLVFRNDVTGNLAYIDYTDVTTPLFEIVDTLDSYHPEVSPNGQWVAFCTSIEGVKGKSSVYVRKLNPTGSDLAKLEVETAAIPRWIIGENGDTAIVFVSDAGNNKDQTEWQQKSTWQVSFANGQFGTPQKMFDGSYHSGISEDMTLAVSGSKLLRARIAQTGGTVVDASARDTIWYNGEQACNVSIAKDGTRRTAFLDFAGNTGKEFVGTTYATHQRILIANQNGQLIQSIAAPAGYTFDHTEWTANSLKSNIVATLTNIDGEHKRIALINVEDSSVTELVQGEELWHPSLWVQKTSTSIEDNQPEIPLDKDSAGVYFTPGGLVTAVKWRYKMELLWKYRNSIEAIVLGSSRALHGVIPDFITSAYTVNFANSNGTLYCSKYFLDNYVWNHIKNLKYIVMSIDIDRGFNTKEQSFFEVTRFNYPGYIYDENHNYWKDSLPEELVQLTSEGLGYWKYAPLLESRGYEQLETNGWGEPKIWTDSMWMNTRSAIYYENFEVLKYILQTAQEHNVEVVGIIFPQNPEYKSTGSFSFHGIQRSKAPGLLQELADLSQTYPNFTFIDENKMGDHDYTDGMAYDNNHLSHEGAIQMTSRIDSILTTLKAR